jgi:hypothetical protein
MKNQETEKTFEGKDISIFLGGALAHSAVAVTILHGICELESDKAIKLKLGKDFVWIPKKALTKVQKEPDDASYYKLAKWFQFSGKALRVVENNLSISGSSNA